MRRALLRATLLVAFLATACRDSTGLYCPAGSFDCNQPGFRIYVLTLRITSPTGEVVAGASVRVERAPPTVSGLAFVDTTNLEGAVVVDFSYQSDAIRPPVPISITVTPPSGSDLQPSIVTDTVVYARTERFRERSIVLPRLMSARSP